MNWSGVFILLGMVAVLVAGFPYTLVAVPFIVWLLKRC
jgi:hypothetical protein